MTDIIVLDSDLTVDPGVIVAAGTLAANRVFSVDQWIADSGGDSLKASWSWIDNRGPRSGFQQNRDSWEVEFRLDFTAIAQNGDGKVIVGMHTTPPDDPTSGPDRVNIVGVQITPGTSAPNRWLARSIIYDNTGTREYGPSSIERANLDLRIKLTWRSDLQELQVRIKDWSSSATLYSDDLSFSGDFDPLTVFGIRDDTEDDVAADMDGYLSDLLQITYIDAPVSDTWILVADLGAVVFDQNGTWNKEQSQRETEVGGLGRDWSSTYHDGAGPVYIEVSGIIERDSCEELVEIKEFILKLKKSGEIVTLYSPITYHTISDAYVAEWEMPPETGRPLNRDFLLVVKSRRDPEVV